MTDTATLSMNQLKKGACVDEELDAVDVVWEVRPAVVLEDCIFMKQHNTLGGSFDAVVAGSTL